jgi:hypothetical protein
MKGYWYFLEVFKESKKRIGPHTDHYNFIFVLIVRRSAPDRKNKKRNTETIASVNSFLLFIF